MSARLPAPTGLAIMCYGTSEWSETWKSQQFHSVHRFILFLKKSAVNVFTLVLSDLQVPTSQPQRLVIPTSEFAVLYTMF